MHDKTRKLLPVVGALALASSALLAGTGSALAKPAPTAAPGSEVCNPGSEINYYRADIDLEANKGRWVYISAALEFDGQTVDEEEWGKFDKRAGVALSGRTGTVPSTIRVTLELGDRNGPSDQTSWTICS